MSGETRFSSEAGAPASKGRILAWYSDLAPKQKTTFWACFVGWATDAMDVMMYSFIIPTLIVLWGMSNTQSGLIGTATLMASSIGGWIGGILADRLGRVRTMQLTIIWFAVFTAACAFAQNPEQLLILRILQGFGFGGEWAAGAALIGEIIQSKDRGKAGGCVHSAWAVGWAIAAILYAVYFSVLDADMAWRAMFVTGLVPAFAAFFIRKFVDEPPIYVAARARNKHSGRKDSFLAIFSPALLRPTLLGALISTGALGGGYAVQIWLPTYLMSVRHLTVLNTSAFLAVTIVASFLGYIVGAYASDALGRRKSFFVFSLASCVTVILYMIVPISDRLMLILGFPLGFFSAGVYSGIGALLNELFPTSIRGSGMGFCFNFGRGMGAVFPVAVGILSAAMPLGQAIGIFTAAAYGVVVVSALLLPETTGRDLES
ncbi:MFS transporter [Brucella pseudogrignonensis]|uniref:MFS transporter n=1 Tax=Brucella pseudogrignonensis TaxID=419475 RepID=UPI003ECD3426